MPRRKRARESLALRGLSGHPILIIDPAAARGVAEAMENSVLPGTQSSYATAIDNYLDFCQLRAIQPWPVDVIWFCAWLLMLARRIKHTSMKFTTKSGHRQYFFSCRQYIFMSTNMLMSAGDLMSTWYFLHNVMPTNCCLSTSACLSVDIIYHCRHGNLCRHNKINCRQFCNCRRT